MEISRIIENLAEVVSWTKVGEYYKVLIAYRGGGEERWVLTENQWQRVRQVEQRAFEHILYVNDRIKS